MEIEFYHYVDKRGRVFEHHLCIWAGDFGQYEFALEHGGKWRHLGPVPAGEFYSEINELRSKIAIANYEYDCMLEG